MIYDLSSVCDYLYYALVVWCFTNVQKGAIVSSLLNVELVLRWIIWSSWRKVWPITVIDFGIMQQMLWFSRHSRRVDQWPHPDSKSDIGDFYVNEVVWLGITMLLYLNMFCFWVSGFYCITTNSNYSDTMNEFIEAFNSFRREIKCLSTFLSTIFLEFPCTITRWKPCSIYISQGFESLTNKLKRWAFMSLDLR